jgi:hypothetical protein
MRQSWESQDVVFYRNEEHCSKRRHSLETPHLNVQLQSHEISEHHNQTAEEKAIIRNPQLFGLGIVLFELAYQTPLPDLHVEYQTSHLKGSKVEDYLLADILSKSCVLSAELGVRYKEIVRKCLVCDFDEVMIFPIQLFKVCSISMSSVSLRN